MKILLLFSLLALTGCAAHHASLADKLRSCGFGNEKFSKFSECSRKAISVSSSSSDDYYSKIRIELVNEINDLDVKVKKKKISQTVAYNHLASYVDSRIVAERQQAQLVAGVVAAAAVGTAVAACVSNEDCIDGVGSSGSGNSAGQYNYAGNCQCPNDITSDGRRCGAMSAYSKSGGASPYCSPERIYESSFSKTSHKQNDNFAYRQAGAIEYCNAYLPPGTTGRKFKSCVQSALSRGVP